MSKNQPVIGGRLPSGNNPSVLKAIREIAVSSSADEIIKVLHQHVMPGVDFIGLIEVDHMSGSADGELISYWSREKIDLPDDFASHIEQSVRQHQVVAPGDPTPADVQDVPGSLKEYALKTLKATSIATFSLTARLQTVGYLVVAHKEPYLYREEEIATIQSLAGQIAVLLENNRLVNVLDRQTVRLERINDLAQEITGAFDVDTLKSILESGLLPDLEVVHLSLAITGQLDFEFHHIEGKKVDKEKAIESDSLIQQAINEARTIFTNKLDSETGGKLWVESGIQHLMIVPLTGRGSPLGTLNVGAGKKGAFEALDLMIVEQIAAQLGIALENIYLFDRLQASLEETTALYSTALAMNAAQNLEEVYDTALTEIVQLSGGDRISIYLAGPNPHADVQYLEVAAIWEEGRLLIEDDSPVYTLSEAPVLSQFPQSRANLTFNDVASDPRLERNLRAYYTGRGVNSLLMIPLSTGTIWLGALLIEGHRDQAFDSEQVRLCRNVADQAALAIDSQLLLKITQQEASFEHVVRGIIDHIRDADSPDAIIEIAAKDLAQSVGLSPEEVRKLQTNPAQLKRADLTDDQRELIEAVADQVSLAIENINLIQNTQRTAVREQLISEMTARLQRSFNVDDVLETAVSTLQEMLEDYDITLRLTPQASEQNQQLVAETPATPDSSGSN